MGIAVAGRRVGAVIAVAGSVVAGRVVAGSWAGGNTVAGNDVGAGATVGVAQAAKASAPAEASIWRREIDVFMSPIKFLPM